MAKKRKTCRKCGGSGQAPHLESCAVRVDCFAGEMGLCTCGKPPCEECGGTGERNRHKMELVRKVMES